MQPFKKPINRYFHWLVGLFGSNFVASCGGGGSSNQQNTTDGKTSNVVENNDDVTIPLENGVSTNAPPEIISIPNTVTDGASSIGTILISDENMQDITVSVTGTDGQFFELQDTQLHLVVPASIDAKSNYDFTITVTDELNQSNSQDVRLKVVQDNELRVEMEETDGVLVVRIFIDPSSDPGGRGVESLEVTVKYDPDLAEVILGSFEHNLEMGVPNFNEDGNLRLAGISLSPQTNLSESIMSFNLSVENVQNSNDLILQFVNINVDGVDFSSSEILVA